MYQVSPQYAQQTAYIGCDIQTGQCGGSGTYCGISLLVPVGIEEEEVSLKQVTV